VTDRPETPGGEELPLWPEEPGAAGEAKTTAESGAGDEPGTTEPPTAPVEHVEVGTPHPSEPDAPWQATPAETPTGDWSIVDDVASAAIVPIAAFEPETLPAMEPEEPSSQLAADEQAASRAFVEQPVNPAEAAESAELKEAVVEAEAGTPPRRPAPPPWAWPSIVLGLAYPALASSARLDAEMIERLPEPKGQRLQALARLPNFWTLVVVGSAVLIAVVFGLFRVGITDVWSESMLFMLLALALGMFSPAAALLMLLVFIPLDIYANYQLGTLEPFFPALAGRAVSWWLLWLLAVALPLMARALPGASLATGTPKNPMLRKILAYGAGALAAGVLLIMWIGAAPFLLRPVFIWSDRFGSPTDPAIMPIQYDGWQIVALGVALVVAVTLLRDLLNVLDEEAVALNAPQDIGVSDEPLVSDQLAFFARLITDAFAVAALGGLITGALDVAVLFGTLIIAKPVADRLLKRAPVLLEALSRVPWVLRFLGGFAFTYIAGLVINGALTDTSSVPFSGEFFSIVISVAVGLFFLQILLEADSMADQVAEERAERDALPPAPDAPSAPVSAGGATIAVIAAALLLSALATFALPAVAQANNCSSRSDCPNAADAEAGAAAGAAAVVAVTAILAGLKVSDHRGRRQKVRRRRKSAATDALGTPTPPAPPPPSFTQRVRQRMLGNYYRD